MKASAILYDEKVRQCSRCLEWRPFKNNFYLPKTGIPYSVCNPCRNIRRKERELLNPAKARLINRKSKYKIQYGITLEEYESMLEQQNYSCKICYSIISGRKSGIFLVDHNHSTGKVRGLLCSKCNSGLGMFNEDLERMERAMQYILKDGVL